MVEQTILVLEDDPETLDEICETLSEEAFRVLPACSGAELWALTKNHRIDLFVLDLILPDENGLSLAKAIRKDSDVGIIIVTGKTGETDRVVGLEIGADDYVTKPFSPRELLARIRSVLRRTEGHYFPGSRQAAVDKSEVVEFRGWKLDMAAYHLFNPHGEEVALTTAEFELLRVFVESPNRVHTRDHLMDRIHGREWAGYDRGIDGLVSRLRKKIKPEPGAPELIKTIRGVGYMFTPSTGSDG